MATVTSRTEARDLAPEVLHPLDQLRGTIRRYVVIEGLLSAAIFVGLWFVLGLILDFGVFKVATWDWVLDAPWWFRAVALVGAIVLLAAILFFRIANRLTKELSYPALALILERRFPSVLGDRLITAVELADVDNQVEYGYSRDMIIQTIDEARSRVGTVPVNDVFNWRRLWVLAAIAAGLFLGVLVFGFASYAIASKSANPYRFGWRMAHVSSIFLERNALLLNTPWPRRSHLELLDFPGDERRIGKNDAAPVIKAKAYRWVIADRGTIFGWRPLVWSDLNEDLIGRTAPELPVAPFRAAAAPGTLGDDASAWTVDQVESIARDDAAAKSKLVAALPGPDYDRLRVGLDEVFAALEARAASPSMGRRLRKLDVPGNVTLLYHGVSKKGDVTLSPQQDQIFAAPVSDLKESVSFVVRAEDFRTTPRAITLVPPPMFTKLERIEYQPAYLHHAPPQDEGYTALAGQRQRMRPQALSLTGDRSVFQVPSGTELVLTATSDVDLTKAYVQPRVGILPRAKPGSADLVPLDIGSDHRTVTMEFRGDYRLAAGRTIEHHFIDAAGKEQVAKVTTTPTVEFELVIEQADGVQSRRQVMIQIIDDQPPVVEIAPDVIRKVGSVYYVTPRARIPFNPESYVRDDRGLSKVAYEIVYGQEDSDIGRAMRVLLATRPFLYAPALPGIGEVVGSTYHAHKFRDLDKGDNRKTGSFGLARFEDQRNQLRRETRDTFLRRLGEEPRDDAGSQVVTRLDLKSPDRDFFDVSVLGLLASTSEVQPRYRLDLNIVATDTNFDTGPKTGQNPEAIHLLVVSEGDLLAKINEEEESFATRLDEALARFAVAKNKWGFVRNQNSTGLGSNEKTYIESTATNARYAAQEILKAHDVVATIVREYRRIHRECIVNQVTEVTRDKFGTFANRIDRVLGENPPPITELEGRRAAAGELTPKMTFPLTEDRIQGIIAILESKNWADPALISDAENAMNLLEQEVSAIRKELGELQTKDKLKKLLETVIETQQRIRKELQDWSTRIEDDLRKPEPKILPVGAIFLAKGESKKVKQGISWRQYPKDDVLVKLTVTDKDKKPVPADVIGLPAEMKLNFEKNSIDFEYELKAGNKEGDYTLTIQPEIGDGAVVTVTVK
jgi:hypothetical protein